MAMFTTFGMLSKNFATCANSPEAKENRLALQAYPPIAQEAGRSSLGPVTFEQGPSACRAQAQPRVASAERGAQASLGRLSQV